MADQNALLNQTRIYHNPRCSKSRQTLALLEDNGLRPEVVRYLDTPPTAAELAILVDAMGCPVRDIIRVKEKEYKEIFANPYRAAARGYIDAVIKPEQTREKLIAGFEMLKNKVDQLPRKKHGNIPL